MMHQTPQQKRKELKNPSLLTILSKSATLAEKIEAIRTTNPYFYLLTPQQKKEK